MVMDHKYKSLESVRDALSLLVYPIQLVVELPGSMSDWFNESLATRRKLQEEIDSLRTQYFMQQAQMQKFSPCRKKTFACVNCSIPPSRSARRYSLPS